MNHFEWGWEQAGTKFYAQGWSPPQTKGIVCIIHGYADHSSRYPHLVDYLCRAGYAVLSYDQYGHGLTEGARGYAPSTDALLDSVKIILDEAATRFPDVPVFLYGHSWGGNTVIHYALARKPKIHGVIAGSPWLRLAFDPPAFKLMLAGLMKRIYPKFAETSTIDSSTISRDKAEVRKYETDPLVHGTVRAGTFFDTVSAAKWNIAHADLLTLPMLLMHGTADGLISIKGTEDFAAHAPKQYITFNKYEGYHHELHNELKPDREKMMADVVSWLAAHL
jgi:acylglycerol lipase